MKKYWFVFCHTELLLEKHPDGTYAIPHQEEPPVKTHPWTKIHNITPAFPDGEVKTFETEPPLNSPGYVTMPLRTSYQHLSMEEYLKAGKCQEILYWDVNTKYCGVCGGLMRMHTDISKRCEQCGKEVWPQLATAIICLIERGDEVLLLRANNFRKKFFGLVAGFVETGETLEEAVAREAMEETGIRVKNIRYYASQPWPYPCGLMVGFYADYDGGEIKLQESEISDGGWFHYQSLPQIPEKMSIARKLIDHWLEGKEKSKMGHK